MQQLLIKVLGNVQSLTIQGLAYFHNLSLVSQILIILAAVIPYVNPIKVIGRASTGIKIVQATLSLIIVAALIRTPMEYWFSSVSPIQYVILSVVFTINNRVDDVLKREFKQIKQMWIPSLQKLVFPRRDSQSITQ